MTRKGRRVTLLVSAMVVVAAATALVLVALQDNIVFFYSPSDLAATAAPSGRIRVGGLVVENSVTRAADGVVDFLITDNGATLPVRYVGVLPDLFREGQGIIAEGRLAPDGRFQAEQVLAKHDEKYMPREVADSLKAKGEWRGDSDTP